MPVARFTKAEITRAVEAVKACGIQVSEVVIGKDGSIRVCSVVDKPAEDPLPKGPKRYNAG